MRLHIILNLTLFQIHLMDAVIKPQHQHQHPPFIDILFIYRVCKILLWFFGIESINFNDLNWLTDFLKKFQTLIATAQYLFIKRSMDNICIIHQMKWAFNELEFWNKMLSHQRYGRQHHSILAI